MPYKIITNKFGKEVIFVEDPPQNDVMMKCGCGKRFLFSYQDVQNKSHLSEVMLHKFECGQEIETEIIKNTSG